MTTTRTAPTAMFAHHDRGLTTPTEEESMMATSDATEPARLTVTLDLRDATWGELRAFVRMAEISGVQDSAALFKAVDSLGEPSGITVALDPRALTHGGR